MKKVFLNKNPLNSVMLNTVFLNGGGLVKKGQGGVIDDGYIRFKDPEVLRVLLANGVDTDGDGGITEEEAAAVTKFNKWFRQNTVIETFDEMRYFTGITRLDANDTNNPGVFFRCTNLKSIVFPETITYLQKRSFQDCSNLTIDINLPNVNDVQDAIFLNAGITSASMPKVVSLPGGTNTITNGAFNGCVNLVRVFFPSLTMVGANTFRGCSQLSEINVTWDKITNIESNAFYNCTSLAIEDLSLPNLESLGQNAFYGVSIKKISNLGKITALPTATSSTQNFGKKDVLEEVVLPDTVTSIANYAFNDYTNLIKCNIPSSVTTIGRNAFNNCNNLYYENLVLNNVTFIDGFAFNGVLIDKIVLPKIQTFSQINYKGAFATITSPMLIDIGEDCTDLNNYLFSYGSKVGITMICRAVAPPTINNPFHASSTYFEVIYVPDASVTAYKEASGWVNYADRIKPLSEYTE